MIGEWPIVDFSHMGSQVCIFTCVFGMMVFSIPTNIIVESVEAELRAESQQRNAEEQKFEEARKSELRRRMRRYRQLGLLSKATEELTASATLAGNLRAQQDPVGAEASAAVPAAAAAAEPAEGRFRDDSEAEKRSREGRKSAQPRQKT
mmetsp:Transcript_88639/g.230028  ORF Transcript_88639/g.230028 Transcript_88639/m.230028 type:complete len:149 (+) Transcript_88639:2-448(+)